MCQNKIFFLQYQGLNSLMHVRQMFCYRAISYLKQLSFRNKKYLIFSSYHLKNTYINTLCPPQINSWLLNTKFAIINNYKRKLGKFINLGGGIPGGV